MTTSAEALSLALRHQQAGQWPQAEELIRQLLTAEPDNADAHNALGIVLFAQGKIAQAEHSFRRAIYLRHDFIDATHNLAKVC